MVALESHYSDMPGSLPFSKVKISRFIFTMKQLYNQGHANQHKAFAERDTIQLLLLLFHCLVFNRYSRHIFCKKECKLGRVANLLSGWWVGQLLGNFVTLLVMRYALQFFQLTISDIWLECCVMAFYFLGTEINTSTGVV